MWLQPESRLDPNKCELIPISETIRFGWPTHLTIITRDQYGDPVYVPNLMVRATEYIPPIKYFQFVENPCN